jgi:hypothetical protein
MKAHDELPGTVLSIEGDWLHVVFSKVDAADPCFRANWASRFIRYTTAGDSVYRFLKAEVRRSPE